MQFYEKLDFLMNITKTSNSALGQKVSLDASHISRLRRGQRNALKDETTINAMADYFARHCTADYQCKGLSDTLNIGITITDSAELSTYIKKWLSNEKDHKTIVVENFLNSFTKINTKQDGQAKRKPSDISPTPPQEEISIFYGIDGKRRAAECFLSEVLDQNSPQTLLLFSDEATDWMTADREFTAKWAKLMIGILSKGNRIIIIHTVSRDLDEMLNAIVQWMPLYMSGLIEPYYYPKKRDGIFKRTLFIAPNVSAVIANSVGNMADQAANLLFRDKIAISAYAAEFYQYLYQCRPLMRIFTSKDDAGYFETLMEFEKEKSNSIIKTESLSLLTMPGKVSSGIMSRIGMANSALSEYQKQRTKIFENNLQTQTFFEIIPVFNSETVNNNKIKVSFSDMMNGGSIYYEKEEYIEHLEHLAHLLNTYDNFHVKLINGMPESNYTVYVKEDLGVIIAKTSKPPVILAVNETNLSAAFWDFLINLISDKDYQNPKKTEELKKLEAYINKLKFD